MRSDRDPNLWRRSARERFEAPDLGEHRTADLLVIGGGYTGCAAALEAARAGAEVCLLEAETIGHGGSGRNVGLVNAGLWLPPDDIVDALGKASGMRLIDILSEGPGMVFRLIEQHGIDCGPTRNGTLHLAHAPSGLTALRERHAQGERLGAPIQLLDTDETARRTGSDAFHGALFDPRAGTLQPLDYCRGLARAAQGLGAKVFERATVASLGRDGGAWVTRSGGHRIVAKSVLVATNAYHLQVSGAPAPSFSVVHFSQFATAPLSTSQRARILAGGEGCWDTARVMTSFRLDGDGRMIVGTMGDANGVGGRIHHAWARRKLRQMYPDLGALAFEHVWTGRIAMTGDHIPKVVAFGPSALMVFGYSGRGISPGTVFGAAAARALLEDDLTRLPVPPQPAYAERLTGARTAFYAFGAGGMHLVTPRSVPFLH